MKRRKPLPPRVRRLAAEHLQLGLPANEAMKWAWILSRRCWDRDFYGYTSVRLARDSNAAYRPGPRK